MIQITRETPVSVPLDGRDRIGYVVGRRATEIAIEKVTASGLAVVEVNRTWYTGNAVVVLEPTHGPGTLHVACVWPGRRVPCDS